MGTIKKLITIADKEGWRLGLATFFACLGEIAGIIPYLIIIVLIDKLLVGALSFDDSLFWVGLALLSHLSRLLLQHFSTILAHQATYEILYSIRRALALKMTKVPMGVMLDRPSGYYKNLLIDQVDRIEDAFAHFIPEVTATILGPLLCLALIFYLDMRMGFASLITIPIALFFLILSMRDYQAKSTAWNQASTQMNSSLVEYVNGIEVIKTFGQEDKSYRKFSDSIKAYHDLTLDWWSQTWLGSAGVQAFLPSILVGTLPIGAYLYMADQLDLPRLIACLVLSLAFIVPLMRLSKHVEKYASIKAALEQIDEFLSMNELQRPEQACQLKGRDIVFDRVSFAYNNKLVLEDVSFSIKEGRSTAIVGPSSSGKSTILKLLAGFWEVNSGQISIGSCPLSDLSQEQIQDLISYVTQDSFLFNMTIEDNIKLGKPDASREDLITASKAAQCHDFIMSMPHGYKSLPGDYGTRLSGGQRQRICIARALLKDAPIILLDEALAFSDPENAHLIQAAIDELVKGKTLVVVGHSLGTIRNANQILVIDKGRLVGIGSHPDLIKANQTYQSMWKNYQNYKLGDDNNDIQY